MNNAKVANGIAAFGATQLGSTIVNGVKVFAISPAGEKAGNIATKFIDWIF